MQKDEQYLNLLINSMVLVSLEEYITDKYDTYSQKLIELMDEDYFNNKLEEDNEFDIKLRDINILSMIMQRAVFKNDISDLTLNRYLENRHELFMINYYIKYYTEKYKKLIFSEKE